MSETLTFYFPSIDEIDEKTDPSRKFHSVQTIAGELEVDAKRISDQITKLVSTFDSIQNNNGSYGLDSIELNIVVTSGGKLAILGSSIQGGITTGIKLTIKKIAIDKIV
jgi:hypothetical protein